MVMINQKMTKKLSKQFKREITVYEVHPPALYPSHSSYKRYEEIRGEMLNEKSPYYEMYKFPVYNGQIYTFENCTVVPVEKSSKYYIVEGFFERIFEILKNKVNGSWCVSKRTEELIKMPLSIMERKEIAKYDKSALKGISFATPENLVYPNMN